MHTNEVAGFGRGRSVVQLLYLMQYADYDFT